MRLVVIVVLTICLATLSSSFIGLLPLPNKSAAAPSLQPNPIFFQDTFGGTAIDTSKWNSTFETSGYRWCSSGIPSGTSITPGTWQNTTVTPCGGSTQSPPYGQVSLNGGVATFSASNSRAFPYIWSAQPSKASPFPSTGDFLMDVRMQFNQITGSGDGFAVSGYNGSDPIGDNPTYNPGRILTLWGDSQGLTVGLFGNKATIVDSLGLHDYLLAYVGEAYSLSVDGIPVFQNIASSVRANAIWIGNPFYTFWGIFNWSTLSVSLVQVTVPQIVANPSSGMLGTKVLVQGLGFPSQTPVNNQILVSFDDMLIGFTTLHNGAFNFTFNVPLSQPGIHAIHAADSLSGAKATTQFTVLAEPALTNLSVTLSVGTIYFPGDTALASILLTSNGKAVGPAGVTIQVNLTRPDNSVLHLNATSVTSGVFKASYPIPSNAALGTYSIIATAHLQGAGDGTALGAFEVKLSWLASHGSTIVVGAVSSLAVVGAAVVAWRKGFFKE